MKKRLEEHIINMLMNDPMSLYGTGLVFSGWLMFMTWRANILKSKGEQ